MKRFWRFKKNSIQDSKSWLLNEKTTGNSLETDQKLIDQNFHAWALQFTETSSLGSGHTADKLLLLVERWDHKMIPRRTRRPRRGKQWDPVRNVSSVQSRPLFTVTLMYRRMIDPSANVWFRVYDGYENTKEHNKHQKKSLIFRFCLLFFLER